MKATLKKNRSFFIKAPVFLLILAVLFQLVQNILLPKSNADLGPYSLGAFLGEPDGTVDMIAIGNSNMAQGLSMMELYKNYGYAGLTSAQPNQTISQACGLLSRILKHQTPKLVILEADGLFPGKGLLNRGENVLKDVLENQFPALYYHDRWKSLEASDFTTTMDISWHHFAKGYKLEKAIDPYLGGDDYMTREKTPVEIDAVTRQCLKHFISMCREKNIEVMLLSIPCPRSWNRAKHDAVADFARREGLTYLDLNPGANTNVPGFTASPDINWNTDTKDRGTHLNINGALKVSDVFGQFLSATRQLPDRRKAPGYSRWAQDLKEYENMLANTLPIG